jgi:hypothetical protein
MRPQAPQTIGRNDVRDGGTGWVGGSRSGERVGLSGGGERDRLGGGGERYVEGPGVGGATRSNNRGQMGRLGGNAKGGGNGLEMAGNYAGDMQYEAGPSTHCIREGVHEPGLGSDISDHDNLNWGGLWGEFWELPNREPSKSTCTETKDK